MRYGELRWPEVDALDKSKVVVVCPIGSLEQHGHHLPLLTDTLLVTAVADAVHERLADRVLLTPTLWLGASDHHLDFPGTVSASNSVYVEMLKDVVSSFVRAGFSRILLLNGHGGNIAPGETAITELANTDDDCDDVYIALASYFTIAESVLAPEKHGMQTDRITHACEYETSLMLHAHRDLVLMERAQGQGDPALPQAPGTRLAGRFHHATATGAMGRPDLATPEKGASLFAAIVDEVTKMVSQMVDWPERKILGPKRPTS